MPLPTPTVSHRPLVQQLGSSPLFTVPVDAYSDSRTHGPKGPTRHVRLPRATSSGGGAIAKSEDGSRCVVAGRESLRILRVTEPSMGNLSSSTDHRSVTGNGGCRIEASRNFWDGSGLHIESASTDVVWGHSTFSNKILTSARNGELIMWDLNKSGSSKYETRSRDHSRSIHALCYSPILTYYCLTGSADGDLRVWDLRDLSKSIMWIRHPAAVRAVVFSPVPWQPLQAVTALDNGSIYRWDLKVGQRGQMDRIPAAHSGPILALDWSSTASSSAPPRQNIQNSWYGSSSSALGLLDDIMPGSGPIPAGASAGDSEGTGAGWLVSGGLDRCVKVWDLTPPPEKSHISQQPTYTLRTSYPVRRVLWRPGYECELAVVSHTDSGSGTSAELHNPGSSAMPTSGVGVGAGLLSAMSSPRMATATLSFGDSIAPADERTHSAPRNGANDPIEIWDVRRGFVAKWAVNDSAVEGGVTDIAFSDSHALWAQHSSGTFSQLDLRHSSKPLDAISRVTVTWDAAGSLAFVSDRPRRWEVPYDDIDPEKAQSMQGWQGSSKTLGETIYTPMSQTMGTVNYEEDDDLEDFVKLAQGYIYEGADKKIICAHNAKVSMETGKVEAAQTWLLLDSLLTDLVLNPPPSPPPPSLHQINPGFPHSISAPAALPTLHTLPTTTPYPPRSMSSSYDILTKGKDKSPGPSKISNDTLGSSSHHSPQRITPTSSATSSPHKSSNSLPYVPYVSTMAAIDQEVIPVHSPPVRLRPSSSRRPSFATPSIYSMHSDSPTDSVRSTTSPRHYGDGALDDSDSSEEEDELGGAHKSDSDDEVSSRHTSASPYPYSRRNSTHPSPLSQVVKQQTWTEDEREDEDSPSPASTSESDSSDTSPKRKSSRNARLSSARSRTRSRSSTVASLTVSSHRTLVRQTSNSSIRTVTAVNAPTTEDTDAGHQRHDTVRERDRPGSSKTSPYHRRVGSEAVSSEYLADQDRYPRGNAAPSLRSAKTDVEHLKTIREAEFRYRELGWKALREIFDSFAESGDVQLCAFLCLVAPKELKVKKSQRLHFLESYIDILSRLRLHTSAAYMRKFSEEEDIRATTALQTTIYTSCSRCRKPIVKPAIGMSQSGKPSGSYAYCLACKKSVTTCSICHLPVRALLFKCAVCLHGGHQECYRNYYMRRPMVGLALPPPQEPRHPHRSSASTPDPGIVPRARGRPTSRSGSTTGVDSDGGSDDSMGMHNGDSTASGGDLTDTEALASMRRALHGHPCAAGCGHFCWAVNKPSSSS